MRMLWSDEKGQMTVELAVAFPVLLVVAVIAMNAMQFFALCSTFDRTAHNLVRTVAASPAYGQDAASSCAAIEEKLFRRFEDEPAIEVSVEYQAVVPDLDRFTAQLTYHPTLFGLGLRSEVFGVSLPALTHSTQLTVDCYKPGVFL